MKADGAIFMIVYFIVTIIVAWVALSVILIWFKPMFYNADGSLNWWVTLWVSALMLLFAWIIMLLLSFVIGFFLDGAKKGNCGPCAEPDPCNPCNSDMRMMQHNMSIY